MIAFYERKIKEHHTEWERCTNEGNKNLADFHMTEYLNYLDMLKVRKGVINTPKPL